MQGFITLNQKFPISKNSVLKDQEFVIKIDQNRLKKVAGLRPALPTYGAVPLPLTQVGGKCLAAVMLDNQDHELRLPPPLFCLFVWALCLFVFLLE